MIEKGRECWGLHVQNDKVVNPFFFEEPDQLEGCPGFPRQIIFFGEDQPVIFYAYAMSRVSVANSLLATTKKALDSIA
jgi:hypothetical protein